jgi:hypothetical protein
MATLADEVEQQRRAILAAIDTVVLQLQNTSDPAKKQELETKLTDLERQEADILAIRLEAMAATLSEASKASIRSKLELQRKALQNVLNALKTIANGAASPEAIGSPAAGSEESGATDAGGPATDTAEENEHQLDAAFDAEPVELLPSAAAEASGSDAFDQFFRDQLPNVQNFTPRELLTKGASNAPGGDCAGLNTDPPQSLWQNVVPLVQVLEEFRRRMNHPVKLLSVYRSPAYNACVGGVGSSQHMLFKAADIKVSAASGTGPTDWQTILKNIRSGGLFHGGIGRYGSFVHVDVRGSNADWTG